jgi:hypothetical protein
MTATNKRLLISESRGDSNRCTPCRGKPDQHATRFSRSVRIWPSTIRISRGPHIATFREVFNRFEQIHCPREEGLLTQFTARRLIGPHVRTQFLSQNSQWNSGERSSFCWQPATRLTGSIYQYAIDTFNTCLRGPTHQSLTNTGGGYDPEGASFSHTTFRPSQPMVFTFHLSAPPGFRLSIIQQLPTELKWGKP